MSQEHFNQRVLEQVREALSPGDTVNSNSGEIIMKIMFILATGGETTKPTYTMGLMFEKMGLHLDEVRAQLLKQEMQQDLLESVIIDGTCHIRFREEKAA